MFATLLVVLAQFPAEPAGVDDYLKKLQSEPEFGARVAALAEAQLGTPYFDGPLGEGPQGTQDKDPLIDLTRVDCVTFVEQTLAFAAETSYAEAFDTLQRLRYRGGEVSYNARNHFLETNWVRNNAAWVKDVTPVLGLRLDQDSRTISRKGFFQRAKASGEYRGEPDEEVTLRFAPIAAADQAAESMPSPALVVFIGKVDWLFALHCGFFVRGTDGADNLIHASSKAGKVVKQPFAEYCAEQSGRLIGFMVYNLRQE